MSERKCLGILWADKTQATERMIELLNYVTEARGEFYQPVWGHDADVTPIFDLGPSTLRLHDLEERLNCYLLSSREHYIERNKRLAA